MKGTKLDFYKANLLNKAKLFAKKPSYILFYVDRFRKYTSTKAFDSFIISYPKSGRTWLQKMMIEAVKAESNGDFNISDISQLRDCVQSFPNILSTHAGSSWEEIIKDHEAIKGDDLSLYNHGKILYLYRDPRDILVSQYYHITLRSGYSSFDKKYIIDNPNVGLVKICNFMNKWKSYAREHQHVMELSYEALKQDPASSLDAVMQHISYPVGMESISTAITQTTLKKMQTAESGKAANPWSNTDNTNNQNAFQSRKGITGEYKTFFSASEIDHINTLVKQHLDPAYSLYL